MSARPTGNAAGGASTIERTTRSEEETRSVARMLAAGLRGGDVVALDGPLGAGKTCFVRGLAEGLGLDPRDVSSPTFVLCQEYESGRGGDALTLFHLDGYRLTAPDELDTVGWEEMLAAGDCVIAVEWAARFGAALPPRHIRVDLAHVDATSRSIEITAPPDMADRLEALRGKEPKTSRPCPTCRKIVTADAAMFPFCSSRCRMADLGGWFNESYRVSREISDADED